ncbi:MAG: ASPIC/UnbV domain-containing protein, partial [Planctomycetota bacterium]|nr:ASPIC/UnbV domain-containing protein [Planctomycetota bacterium]
TEEGAQTGFAFDRNGGATGAMGIDVGDFRQDGSYGVCIGNFAKEMSSLYVKDPRRMRFTDDAIGEGIGSPSRSRLSFGLFFFDYDLDGRLDLLQVNGHLEESINEVQPSQTYLQRPQLFWNQGPDARRCYTEVPPETAGDLDVELAGRGSAFADVDGDGDQDVLICQVGRAPVLLRNDQELGRRWLRVRLEQDGANRHGLGATVEVTTGGVKHRRTVTATRSYLSQSELPVTFGLGAEGEIEGLEVVWPDGEHQELALPIEPDQELVVRR